jgi:tetratricopeptide (TPR) repeat protein
LPLALAAAVLPPLAFVHTRIPQWTHRAEELLGEMRLTRAWEVIAALSDLGSTTPVAGRPPRQLAADVRREVTALAASVARPLPASSLPAARVEYARRLAMLDLLAEAAQLLAPLADRDVDAALLRATALQKLGRWDESSRDFRAVLDLSAALDPDQTAAARVPAYEGLAFNARAAGRPADAEAAYREGLERVPGAAAHFHFLLGRHYDLGGRPALALEHLHEAVRLDPGRYGDPARPLIDQLTRATPGCLLPRPPRPR